MHCEMCSCPPFPPYAISFPLGSVLVDATSFLYDVRMTVNVVVQRGLDRLW
jgi:hypothetical protein